MNLTAKKEGVKVATLTESVLCLRKIYSDMTDDKFADYYAKRYRQRYSDVMEILDSHRRD